MTDSGPIPTVLCGRRLDVGRPVSEALLPEYEVIHFTQSYEDALAELPHILAGRDPESANPNDIGTHDYSRPVRVVMFGRGFSLQQVEEIRKACSASTRQPVAWVAGDGDPAKIPTGPPGPGYPRLVAEQVKETLKAWKEEGEVDKGVLLY